MNRVPRADGGLFAHREVRNVRKEGRPVPKDLTVAGSWCSSIALAGVVKLRAAIHLWLFLAARVVLLHRMLYR